MDTLPDLDYVDGVRSALADSDADPDLAADGMSVVATSVTPTLDGPWPELEVSWRLVSTQGASTEDPPSGEVRLPFGRDWLDESFYVEPADYADLVTRELQRAARRALRPTVDHPDTGPALSDDEVSRAWAEFIAELEDLGSAVREVGRGRVEVDVAVEDGGSAVLTFLVTPDQWADLRRRGHGAYGLGELLGAFEDDEIFFHVADDGLTPSTREELPPVRGTALLRRIAALRARDPGATLGWYAYAPDVDHDRGGGGP